MTMEEMNYFGFENGDEYEISDKKARERIDELSSNLDSQGLLNKFDGKLEQGYKNASGTIVWDSTNVCIKNTISVSSGDKVTVKLDSVATRLYTTYRNNGVFVSEEINYNTNNVTVTIPSGANGLDITMVYDSTTTPSQVGNLYVYINNAIDALKNDLDKLNSLPIGSIIQIEAAKDNIETTTQKYGWQYLGTSNIECNDGSVKLLVTNVYRKNN